MAFLVWQALKNNLFVYYREFKHEWVCLIKLIMCHGKCWGQNKKAIAVTNLRLPGKATKKSRSNVTKISLIIYYRLCKLVKIQCNWKQKNIYIFVFHALKFKFLNMTMLTAIIFDLSLSAMACFPSWSFNDIWIPF